MDQLEMARKGGKAVKKKYGKSYFKDLRAKRRTYPKRVTKLSTAKPFTTASR